MEVTNLYDPGNIVLPGEFPSDPYHAHYQAMSAPELEFYHYKELTREKAMPHVHDHFEFYFFLDGNVQYVVGARRYELKPGDILIIRPGEVHFPEVRWQKDAYTHDRAIVWLSKAYYRHLMEVDESLLTVFDLVERTGSCHFRPEVGAFSQISLLLRSCWYEGYAKKLGYAIVQKALFAQILVILNRIAAEERLYPMKPDATGDLYAETVRYIHEHVKGKITLGTLSEQMFVSESYISRVFRQHLGLSVHQYILRLKLSHIVRDAATGKKVTSLAEEYSFGSYSAFYRAFLKEFGVSPKEYFGG